jgi:chromosome segregation ATPase
MTIEERFKAAEAAVVSLTAERDDLRKTVEASVVDVSAELDAAKVSAASQDQKVQELEVALADANAKISELEAAKATGSAEAAVILASSGVAPVAAPVAQAVVGSICEQYAAMPVGAERRAFFKKHKAVLFSAK